MSSPGVIQLAAVKAESPWWFMLLVMLAGVVLLRKAGALARFGVPSVLPQPMRSALTGFARAGFFVFGLAWFLIGLLGFVSTLLP